MAWKRGSWADRALEQVSIRAGGGGMDDGTRIAFAVVEAVGAICVSYVVLKTWASAALPAIFRDNCWNCNRLGVPTLPAPGASYVLGAMGVIAFFSLYAVGHVPEVVGALFETEAAGTRSTASRPNRPIWYLRFGRFSLVYLLAWWSRPQSYGQKTGTAAIDRRRNRGHKSPCNSLVEPGCVSRACCIRPFNAG